MNRHGNTGNQHRRIPPQQRKRRVTVSLRPALVDRLQQEANQSTITEQALLEYYARLGEFI